MRDGFQSLRTELHADIGALQVETHADSRALWTEMALSRRWLFGMWATMALGFVGVVIQVSLR